MLFHLTLDSVINSIEHFSKDTFHYINKRLLKPYFIQLNTKSYFFPLNTSLKSYFIQINIWFHSYFTPSSIWFHAYFTPSNTWLHSFFTPSNTRLHSYFRPSNTLFLSNFIPLNTLLQFHLNKIHSVKDRESNPGCWHPSRIPYLRALPSWN